MIRVDAVWLAVEPLDMRAGTEAALARVVHVFGAAHPHHAYLFANRRANRMKVLVHDGLGIWLAARRLHQGKFVWSKDEGADATPEFSLEGEVVPTELPFDTPGPARKATQKVAAPAAAGDPEVLSYRHADRRKNNPEVGLVNVASDPQQPKQTWAYDPHLDPVLNFDSGRAELETLIDDALAAGDDKTMRAALEELQRRGSPCVFQPIVDGISGRSWTAFQRDRGRRFKLIVDAVSA